MKARAKLLNGEIVEIGLQKSVARSSITVVPVVDLYDEIEYIDVGYDMGVARVGDEGYYIVPQGTPSQDSFLTEFVPHEDVEYFAGGKSYFLPIFGVRHREGSFFGRVVGFKEECRFLVGIQNGDYYFYPRFMIRGEQPTEEISVIYTTVSYEDATYSNLAGFYRTYLLENGICRSLKDRMNPTLRYATDSLYVRIRQAWKPVPSPVAEQTDENEPPIHVACTFARVIDLMEECKRQGVEKAEFCLVGWNKSGHDGRWPQIFPVEPLLGGELELKRLLARAKELGYRVSCHTNSTEAYSIADCYREEDLLVDKNGNYQVDREMWGGGIPRKVCPVKAYEFASQELPKVKALGFNGMHYVDVVSIEDLLDCRNPDHPCSKHMSAEYNRKIGALCQDLFGGFASEGGRDFAIPTLDYALYLTFRDPEKSNTPLASRYIPFWQLIYHGICLSNPFTQTVNVLLKAEKNQLLAHEYGARPSFYYYSKFMTDSKADWMGDTDMRCGTDDELSESVSMLKQIYDEYHVLSYLQEHFMVSHELLGNGTVQITYSDGSQMTVDYCNRTVVVLKDGNTVFEKTLA